MEHSCIKGCRFPIQSYRNFLLLSMKFCEDLEAEPSKKLQITLTDEGYKHLKQADLVPYKDKIPIANRLQGERM